jgi:hypothetical protein
MIGCEVLLKGIAEKASRFGIKLQYLIMAAFSWLSVIPIFEVIFRNAFC